MALQFAPVAELTVVKCLQEENIGGRHLVSDIC